MRRVFFLLFFAGIVLGGLGFFVWRFVTGQSATLVTSSEDRWEAPRMETWDIGTERITVEVVTRPEGLRRGLGGRSEMATGTGMLFVMGARGIHPFWMKDMHFPIDILWIADGRVVFLAERVQPPSETHGIPRTVIPPVSATHILEVPAGDAARYGIRVGSVLPDVNNIEAY